MVILDNELIEGMGLLKDRELDSLKEAIDSGNKSEIGHWLNVIKKRKKGK